MTNFSTIKDRVIQFIEYKGLSKNKFYIQTGISNGTLDKKSGLTMETVEKFYSTFPEINPEWLLTGQKPMLKNDYSLNILAEPVPTYLKIKDPIKQNQLIPLYNLEAAAGMVTLFKDSKKFEPVDFLQIPNLPKSDGAVYVTGDSMYPLLKSGDIVVYKKLNTSYESIFWGEMYLVSVEIHGDELTTVKWIQKSELGDHYVKLVSQNQHHQAKDVHMSEIKALALVKASVRINSMS